VAEGIPSISTEIRRNYGNGAGGEVCRGIEEDGHSLKSGLIRALSRRAGPQGGACLAAGVGSESEPTARRGAHSKLDEETPLFTAAGIRRT
jgi:hypothetical protein